MKTAAELSEELNLYLPHLDPDQEVPASTEMRMMIVAIGMDTSKAGHVIVEGKRGPVSDKELEAFDLTNGQEVTAEEFQRIRAVRNAS